MSVHVPTVAPTPSETWIHTDFTAESPTDPFDAPNIERPLNVTANRVFIQISTTGAGNWFNLSKIVLTAIKDPFAPVVGVSRPSGILVAVSPLTSTVVHTHTKQFTATVSGTANARVIWTADSGAITGTGLYTAPVTPGTYNVTATSVADSLKSATVPVVVTL